MKWLKILTLISLSVCGSVIQALEPGATLPRSDHLPSQLPEASAKPKLQIPIPDRTKPLATTQQGPRFVLREIHFVGNTVFDDQQLQNIIARWLGREIAPIDLESIRFELAGFYRQAGYINSGVLLPQQHIQAGVVRYQIIEGRLSEIHIEGAGRLADRYLQTRLQTNPDEPLNQQELLDRFQMLLNDPLIERLNGTLKPGARPGESLLDLQVSRRQPYALNIGLDNYTPPSVGAYTGRLDGALRNLTGWGDLLDLNLNYSEGLQSLGSQFSVPIAAAQTRLNLNFQGSQARIVDSLLQPLNVENAFYHLSAGLSQPLYLSTRRSFIVDGQFAYRYTRNALLGTDTGLSDGSEANGKSTVSVFRLSQNYLDKTLERVISLRSTFSVGADLLGATTHYGLTRYVSNGNTLYYQEPDSRFFSWLGQARFVQQLDPQGSELFMRGDLQLAAQSLLPLERFALGGIYTIRGYRQNELVRDNGYALALEVRYPLLNPEHYAGNTLKLVPFVDYGRAWNDRQAGQTLWSLGVGLQWQWQLVNAEFYWAQAMNKAPVVKQQGDIQDSGIHFRLSFKIL